MAVFLSTVTKLDNTVIPDPWLKQKVIRFRRARNLRAISPIVSDDFGERLSC